jgi:cytidine kinase
VGVTRMINLIAFGILLDDIVTWRGDVQMSVLGGGGAQTAWAMAVAAPDGVGAGLVGGVHDTTDDAVFAPLHAAGVDLAGVRRSATPTARAWQLFEADETRTQVWRVPPPVLREQLRRTWDDLPPPYRAAQHFHWGIHPEAPDLDFARHLTDMGKRVSLEAFRAPSAPLTPDALAALMASCAVFSAGLAEAQTMAGTDDLDATLVRFAAAGCRILTLRMGRAGSLAVDFARGERVHVPAYPTQVIDSTGAGNAWCGAFLARLDEGIAIAASHAAVAASYMVEQVGIPAAPPTADDYAQRFDHVWQKKNL